jgi:hypothetical protein
MLVSGCVTAVKTPERLYSVDEETAALRKALDNPSLSWNAYADITNAEQQRAVRNNLITARMYAIDIQYTNYESALMHDAQEGDFIAKAASLTLTTTASLIPVAQTSRTLSGIATGVTGIDDAYNEKVLRAQLIQNIQSAMRISRHDQAAIIYANMKCSSVDYTLPMALSDLETYYRAGTVTGGIIKLTQTVSKAAVDAKANEDSKKPGGGDANATLEGNATAATVKAEQADGSTCVQQSAALMSLQLKFNDLKLRLDKLTPKGGEPAR